MSSTAGDISTKSSTTAAGRWIRGLALGLAVGVTSHPSVAARAAGFTSMPPADTGVAFTNHLAPDRALANHILLNGSGVAFGDIDGDGLQDLFLPALQGGSTLFRNLGQWRFTNITHLSFAAKTFDGMDATGAVLADLDGDRLPDLLVNGIGTGTRCFLNRGTGRFEETTAQSGLAGRGGPSSFALADIDRDGDLDLYVVRYRSSTVRDEFQQRFGIRTVDGKPVLESVNGRPVTEPDLVGRFSVDAQGRITEHGEADGLYANDGKGVFQHVPFDGGAFRDESGQPLTRIPYDWGLAAMFRDVDGDGILDLYVCNDLGSPDRIWIGDGKGGFRAIARSAIRKTSWFSMGVDFGDLDRDGHDDFLVTDMLSRDPVRRQADFQNLTPDFEPFTGLDARPQVPRNTLQRGRGEGSYAEVAWMSGIAATEWSWSPVFLDVDLDGFEDVLITTGFERNVQDADIAEEIERIRQAQKLSDAAALQLRRRFPSHALPNQAWRNLGGMRFEENGTNWGFNLHGISQGIALADLDNDGDLDVVLNNQNASATLLRNDATAPRILVRLRGRGSNTDAVGARIEVEGGPVPQQQVVTSGGRFLSGDAPTRMFATRSAADPVTVRVTWPDGRRSVHQGVRPGSLLVLEEPPGDPAHTPSPTPPGVAPLFADASSRLRHRHAEEPFDEGQLQPIIARTLSTQGPGVAWGDLNLDGHEDLVISAGRRGLLGILLNDGTGGFRAVTSGPIGTPSTVDQTGVLVHSMPGRGPQLLVPLSNYETPRSASAIRTLDLAQGNYRPGGIRLSAAIGAMALADVDGDGRLDLFAAGRASGGRYPEGVSSALFLGQESGWVPSSNNAAVLQQLGMVTAAAFSDLDVDGDVDLVVTTDWGPIRILDNQGGMLTERTNVPLRWAEGDPRPRPRLLEVLTGWWNSVTPVDFDGDGRMDLIAGNWGRNTRQQVEPGRTAALYHGDFAGLGAPIALETFSHGNPERDLPWVPRDVLGAVWPALLERYPTRASFGAASVPEILKEVVPKPQPLRVTTLDSVALWNRGDHWVVQPLPERAQEAPVFGVVAADFNGDGKEDLFLAQNSAGAHGSNDRADAGVGLILIGDGRGGWTPLSVQASGIRVHGEQRGAAAADYDADGRVDLVVTQNGDSTRLFRNVGARPGVEVRFRGPAGNPSGIGVRVRAMDAAGNAGPVREIRAGSGYLSQDSAVLVFAGEHLPTALEVRWPGRQAIQFPIPSGRTMIEVSADGVIAPK